MLYLAITWPYCIFLSIQELIYLRTILGGESSLTQHAWPWKSGINCKYDTKQSWIRLFLSMLEFSRRKRKGSDFIARTWHHLKVESIGLPWLRLGLGRAPAPAAASLGLSVRYNFHTDSDWLSTVTHYGVELLCWWQWCTENCLDQITVSRVWLLDLGQVKVSFWHLSLIFFSVSLFLMFSMHVPITSLGLSSIFFLSFMIRLSLLSRYVAGSLNARVLSCSLSEVFH